MAAGSPKEQEESRWSEDMAVLAQGTIGVGCEKASISGYAVDVADRVFTSEPLACPINHAVFVIEGWVSVGEGVSERSSQGFGDEPPD